LRAPGYVLERRERRACAARFYQIDSGRGHVTPTHLGKAQAGFSSRLLDCAWAQSDARKSTLFWW
jgi:hypothetical protein